jgi:hypothetical protein
LYFQMDIIRRILKFLGWHRARPVALKSSPFRKLPLELVLLIASYLPLESAASFSLSCYSLYSGLETECLQPLKEAENSVVYGFLRLLERDLPAHILCPHCNKFHSMSFAEGHLLSQRYSLAIRHWRAWFLEPAWLACWIADSKTFARRGIYDGFSETIFRMAMKAHRQGHDTTKLLSLLSYGTDYIMHAGFVEQRTATVRIQDGSLLIREQRVFMIPSSQKLPLPWYYSFAICPHIFFPTTGFLDRDMIRPSHTDETERYKNRYGIIYCEHCYTEFRIDFKSYGEVGTAMFITRWMDLGEGRDASDLKWRCRIVVIQTEFRKSWTNVKFRRGSICAAFEQKAKFKFDSLLTQQDEKNLCKKSPWPWPEDTVSFDKVSPFFGVRNGRFRS